MIPKHTYDIVIVGAGMVGATLACALDPGWRVAVLETHLPGEVDAAQWDLRVSSINRVSEAVFESIGAWQGMARRRVSPFREMFVWDEQAHIHFDCAEIGEPLLGHIIENRVVQSALLERLEQADHIDLIEPATLQHLALDEDAVTLTLDQGRQLRTRLVVGADGANSRVRALSGIPITRSDYHQKGLVATVRTSLPHRETAWQRFLPDGPLAFLPLARLDPHTSAMERPAPDLGDGCCSIVWSQSTAQADRRLGLDDTAFRAELQRAWGPRLGEILAVGPRAAFPLVRRHALQYIQPRLALVGDAAHTIHPLAGQGVNLGILDAAALAEVLQRARQRHKDPGNRELLRRYERGRRGDNALMQTTMDGFYHLFGQTGLPITTLRRLGLNLTDSIGPLKHAFMRHAMGRRTDLPGLAKHSGHSRRSDHPKVT